MDTHRYIPIYRIGKLSVAKARLNAPRGDRDGAYACRTLANVGRLKYAESVARERRGREGVYSKHFDACGPSSRALARRTLGHRQGDHIKNP